MSTNFIGIKYNQESKQIEIIKGNDDGTIENTKSIPPPSGIPEDKLEQINANLKKLLYGGEREPEPGWLNKK